MNTFSNKSLIEGVRQTMYLVTPRESTFENVDDIPNYFEESAPIFLAAIFLEAILLKITGAGPTTRLNDGFKSLATAMINQMTIMTVLSAVKFSLYIWVYERYRLIELPWDSPTTWWLCFFTRDLAYYFFHRAGHEVNAFWAAHSTHHTSEDFNLTTALRDTIVQGFITRLCYLPMAFAFPPTVFFVHDQLNLLYTFWLHTELIRSLGPLEYVLNTPSHHRVHHGRNRYCIDKNYGGTLIIWDRMFGTFQAETEPVVYGLVHPMKTWDPVGAFTCAFVDLFSRAYHTEGYVNKFNVFIKGPGWTPGKPRLGEITDIPDIHYPQPKYDSSLPIWTYVYLFYHFLLELFIFLFLAYKQKIGDLPDAILYGGIVVNFYGVYATGSVLDKRSFAPYIEVFRNGMILISDFTFFPLTTMLHFPMWGVLTYRWLMGFWLSLWVILSMKNVTKKEKNV